MTSVPTTKPPGFGWLPFASDMLPRNSKRPSDYAEVELWREGWQETRLSDPNAMSPLTNVFGLYWRPAGPELTDKAKLGLVFRSIRK